MNEGEYASLSGAEADTRKTPAAIDEDLSVTLQW